MTIKKISKEILNKIKDINKKLDKKIKAENVVGIGKRGVVLKIDSNTCIKISKGIGFLKREYLCLKELNKKGIGPKVERYFEKHDAFTMEYLPGVFFEEYVSEQSSKLKILMVIYNIIDQLFILDKLRLNKEEMHRPVKHIIVKKDKVILIDFERCKTVKKPSNLTQFIQYLTSKRLKELLSKKKIVILTKGLLNDVRKYKQNITTENLNKIKARIWFYPESSFERIYTVVRTIPTKKLATYGQVAKISHTNPRVVGFAMNKNPFSPIVPCHRVIGNDSLGGFAQGVDSKKKMLIREGIKNFNQESLKKHLISNKQVVDNFKLLLNELKEHLKPQK